MQKTQQPLKSNVGDGGCERLFLLSSIYGGGETVLSRTGGENVVYVSVFQGERTDAGQGEFNFRRLSIRSWKPVSTTHASPSITHVKETPQAA